MEDEISKIAEEVYWRLLPVATKKYGRRYILLDRIHDIHDFEQFFFCVVYNSVKLYRKNHISKDPIVTSKWKRKNGKSQSHRMKIDTFVFEQLKKEIENLTRRNVIVKCDGYEKEMSYQSFMKKRAYYKAGGFEVEFVDPEIPFSEMCRNSDYDDDNFDPENYRDGLDEEINDLLYSSDDDKDREDISQYEQCSP